MIDYYILKEAGSFSIEAEKTWEYDDVVFCRVKELERIENADYLSRNNLVSDRLKNFILQCVPDLKYKLYVFLDHAGTQEKSFWKLELPECTDFEDCIKSSRENGEPLNFTVRFPEVFCVRPKKGIILFIVHLSIAEGMARRGILGAKLVNAEAYTG